MRAVERAPGRPPADGHHGTGRALADLARAVDHAAHSGEETRARILHVALELIADNGFAGTTTREIAERLGFTKAALYYHFHTKDELLEAILEPVLDEVETLVRAARDAARGGGRSCAPRRLLEGYVALVATHADLIRVLYNDPSVKQCSALLAVVPLFEAMVPLLADCDEPGTVERTRVRAALGAVHSAILHARPGDDADDVRQTAIESACGALGLATAARPRQR